MTGAEQTTVGVVQDPERAAAMLHPLRMEMLATLRQPHSASSLAQHLGLPRQKVNYHLRELEKHALVELVEEKRKGNCVERILRTRALSYVISPEAVGGLAADPAQIQDRFSSAYLTALAAKALRDLGVLRSRADLAGKRLATISLQADVRFASSKDRNAFAEELAEQVARLSAKYHDERSAGGRRFQFFMGAYPAITNKEGRTS
jgi:DNA-binding transcriptional ArsR family regulator